VTMADAEGTQALDIRASLPADQGASERILVVDDEPDVEALLVQKFRRQLRSGEIEFVFARDGQDALDKLGSVPDIVMVLSDINMPRMNGLDLLQQLNQRHKDLSTVIISAYGDMDNIRAAMNLGAFDFITKPIEFNDLETTIAKTLAHLTELRDLRLKMAKAEKARSVLSRYFSPKIANALSETPNCLEPGGTRRLATFLFTDLAGFTSLVESHQSDLVIDILNDYLDSLAGIIFEHDGTVMKVMGDAVHAVFGAPVSKPDHAERAVACALAIDRYSEMFRARCQEDGLAFGVTRVGVNSGSAIIGNFGGVHFFDYAAYGDAVNIASRLENVNKALGTHICVSQTTVDQIPSFLGRPAGNLLLRGRNKPLKAFEPLSEDRANDPAIADYQAAYALLEGREPSALQAFAALIGRVDDDPLGAFHLRRLLGGKTDVDINLSY